MIDVCKTSEVIKTSDVDIIMDVWKIIDTDVGPAGRAESSDPVVPDDVVIKVEDGSCIDVELAGSGGLNGSLDEEVPVSDKGGDDWTADVDITAEFGDERLLVGRDCASEVDDVNEAARRLMEVRILVRDDCASKVEEAILKLTSKLDVGVVGFDSKFDGVMLIIKEELNVCAGTSGKVNEDELFIGRDCVDRTDDDDDDDDVGTATELDKNRLVVRRGCPDDTAEVVEAATTFDTNGGGLKDLLEEVMLVDEVEIDPGSESVGLVVKLGDKLLVVGND